jgi:hypothetical protein
MKTKFLVSKNLKSRLDFIRRLKGRKIAIFGYKTDIVNEFDVAIDMHQLMKEDYYLNHLAMCNKDTTIVLIDVLVKHGIYVHPFGKIFAFSEQAKETIVIDTFAFKWDEKQIVRPFLFIDPSILGSSMIKFYQGAANTVENYYSAIKTHIKIDVQPLEIEVIQYHPTQEEVGEYNKLKHSLIIQEKQPKNKIVNSLIEFVDNLQSRKAVMGEVADSYLVTSNKPKNKFMIYDTLRDENIHKITFLSSNIFGADEIELNKTKLALERHNILIRLLNGN